MEKCDMCGKETPIMQLGVRYCFKCGESVIRVCRTCDTSPFYCKHCKRKKSKGWHESPDASGKAPDHRDAKLRAQAKHARNTPMEKHTPDYSNNLLKPRHLCMLCSIDGMTKEEADAHSKSKEHLQKRATMDRQLKEKKLAETRDQELLAYLSKIDPMDELYHVTFKSKSSKLLKEGIQPKKSSTYTGMFGRKLKDLGTIYAFTNFDDAVRWASKMLFDFKKPTIIVAFRGSISEWEQDTHWQSAGAKGKWLKKKGAVLPNDIIEIIGLSQKMTQAVVQTGGTSRELTRMHEIVEVT